MYQRCCVGLIPGKCIITSSVSHPIELGVSRRETKAVTGGFPYRPLGLGMAVSGGDRLMQFR